MEAKSSSQVGAFLYPNLPIAFTPTSAVCSRPNLKLFFFHQTVANLPLKATGNNKYSQNVQNLFFFGKIDLFLRNKTVKFFKIAKCSDFFLECVSNGIIS